MELADQDDMEELLAPKRKNGSRFATGSSMQGTFRKLFKKHQEKERAEQENGDGDGDGEESEVETSRTSGESDEKEPAVRRVTSFRQGMVHRVRSLQRMVKRNPKELIVVSDTEVSKLKETLPPPAPESLDGTGKRDISLYTTTWNMDFCKSPTEDVVQYWLPKGYDIYVIALQNCISFLELSRTCVSYLDEGEDTYDEFMDFMHVQSDSIEQQNSLILLFLVHSSLLEEDVFQRSKLKRQKPSSSLTTSFPTTVQSIVDAGKRKRREYEKRTGGVLIMQFEVFDTVVLVINAQLTKGIGRTRERLADIRSIVSYVNNIEADHVILMGDMGTDGIEEFDDYDVLDNLKKGKPVGEGWGDKRFEAILEVDEITSVLHTQVKSFSEFDELPINFPPTSVRRVDPEKVTHKALAERFHANYDILSIYEKNGRIPSYNQRIFFKSISAQHEPGFKGYKTGSCEGVRIASNVPIFSTFRVGNKSFSISEEEFVKTLVDEDDLKTIANELLPYAPEDVRKQVEERRVRKMDSAKKLYLQESQNTSHTTLIEHEDEEEEEEADSDVDEYKPRIRTNNKFRHQSGLRRESYVTVYDLLSLAPPTGPRPTNQGSEDYRRDSMMSSISQGPPPPPLATRQFRVYDEDEDSLFSEDDDGTLF